MTYRQLARFVRFCHAAWIAVLIGSIALAVMDRESSGMLQAVVLVTFVSQILWGKCPLTLLERSLLVKAGERPYEGSYLVDFFRRRFGVEIPPWIITVQLVFLTTVVAYLSLTGRIPTIPVPVLN